jgi:hypothetical protein
MEDDSYAKAPKSIAMIKNHRSLHTLPTCIHFIGKYQMYEVCTVKTRPNRRLSAVKHSKKG